MISSEFGVCMHVIFPEIDRALHALPKDRQDAAYPHRHWTMQIGPNIRG